jgi:signal peptidase I
VTSTPGAPENSADPIATPDPDSGTERASARAASEPPVTPATPTAPDREPHVVPQRTKGSGALGLLRETVLVVGIALVLSLIIKTFLVQAFYIPSGSMENTLLRGDKVIVSKLTPGPFDLKRGDVVVFSDSGKWLPPAEKESQGVIRDGVRSGLMFVGLLPADSDEHLIKRVIGLPGDKVACCDAQGRVTVNGKAIDEPYLYPGDDPSEQDFSITVPAGRLWVMGDHRSDSADSRSHLTSHGGTIPLSDVVGRAFVKVWPLDRFGLLRNPTATFSSVP